MDFATALPRDLGFAFAALALADGAEEAAGLADGAPGGAAARVRETTLAAGPEEERKKLAAALEKRRKGGGSLGGVHASWLADALLDEPVEVAEAVMAALPERQGNTLSQALDRMGRKVVRRTIAAGGMRAQLEPVLVERFIARAFARTITADPPKSPTARWLWDAAAKDGASEASSTVKELGLMVVVRAFSRIGREDLAKLCQGLAPNDSVRLVSGVVEITEKSEPDALRETQRLHLKILKAAGISRELFYEAGLAFLGAGLLSREDEATREALAHRLPEQLGRRLLELSSPGAIPDEATCQAFADELPGWLADLGTRGIATSWKAGDAAESAKSSGEEAA